MKAIYLFGDSDGAARRLELLAQVFEGSTRAFLVATAGDRRVTTAIDLGCGPGFTTHLIADALKCERAIGLDASTRFIALAQATANERVSFQVHDVCALPLPGAPADLIFCRFLLTHLKDPADAAAKWVTQLKPDGLLMVEETEAIHTGNPTFTRYLGIVEAMLSSQSNSLYAGRIAATLSSGGWFKALGSESRRVTVRNADAARMFAMNMRAWEDNDFLRANCSRETLRELEAALGRIADDSSPASDIEWTLRQATFGR